MNTKNELYSDSSFKSYNYIEHDYNLKFKNNMEKKEKEALIYFRIYLFQKNLL